MDVYKADAIPASHHFAMEDHIFNRDASFIIIEQIREGILSRETKKNLLKQAGELLDPVTRDFTT